MAQDGARSAEARIPGIDFDPEADESPAEESAAAPTPRRAPASYSMLEPRMKAIYGQFYKETYFSDKRSLDTRTQELIAIACSVLAKCEGCLDGHIKKALGAGATKEQISEALVIALGISAAAIVDQTDRAAARLGLNHFPANGRRRE